MSTETNSDSSISSDVQPASIMVVDDVENNRDLLARRLIREGHTVHLAENGREAIEKIEQCELDLVLLDIIMPVMDGYQVLKHLKADPMLRHIPVIIISASEDSDGVIKCIRMGAEDYLPKPFNRVLLQARINACLQRKRIHDREQDFLQQLETEKTKSEKLLSALFPHVVVQELRGAGVVRPRRYQNVAVGFCDIVEFTSYSDAHDPEEVLQHLQGVIEAFEQVAEKHDLEKIKTIGDCFMATAGLMRLSDNPVMDCVKGGLDMIAAAREHPPGWDVRVGIHCGPVVAGIVGKEQYQFDVWGDTVNTAARVESCGTPGCVNVSGDAWRHIMHECRGSSRTEIVKGKDPLEIVEFKNFRK